jgi:hypothetical protein
LINYNLCKWDKELTYGSSLSSKEEFDVHHRIAPGGFTEHPQEVIALPLKSGLHVNLS